jgi:hypothetical protein
LTRLYPTLIVPPIPSKQTISDYAIKQAKAREDAALIARRKRMLQTFLNRIARHPILSNEHVFHRFLDGEVSWVRVQPSRKNCVSTDLSLLKTEVLHSPPISQLPKNILKAPAHNPTDSSASQAYEALPNPSPAHPLRRPDQRFLDSEVFTNKFASHLSGPMEKVTRRTMKRWSGWFLALAFLPLSFYLCRPLTISYPTSTSCRIRPRPYGAWRGMERFQPQ